MTLDVEQAQDLPLGVGVVDDAGVLNRFERCLLGDREQDVSLRSRAVDQRS